MFQLRETLVHFRNICQHSHDDNIRSAIAHYRKRLSHDFNALLNRTEPDASTPETKLKQLVFVQGATVRRRASRTSRAKKPRASSSS